MFVTTSAKSYGYTCWQLWLLSNAEIKQTKFDYMMITTYIIYSQCRLLFFFHKNRVTVSLRLVKLRKSLLVSDGKILGKSFFMCFKTDISMWRLDVIRIRLTPPVSKTWKKKAFYERFYTRIIKSNSSMFRIRPKNWFSWRRKKVYTVLMSISENYLVKICG